MALTGSVHLTDPVSGQSYDISVSLDGTTINDLKAATWGIDNAGLPNPFSLTVGATPAVAALRAFNAENILLSVPDSAWVITNSAPTIVNVSAVLNGHVTITALKAGT